MDFTFDFSSSLFYSSQNLPFVNGDDGEDEVMPGQIRDIFLLRGLARETRHWGAFLPQLRAAFPDSAIHPLEIPGNGRLHRRKSPLSVDDSIAEIRPQYLAHASTGGATIIIGVSLGGMIAIRWLERYPADFTAAVVINTSSRHSPFFQRVLPSALCRLLTVPLSMSLNAREKKVVAMVCNLAENEKTAAQWAGISRTAPVSTTNLLRQLYAAATSPPPIRSATPILILASRRDRLVSVKCSEKLASLLETAMIYHPAAGHDLTTDDPGWCVQQIFSWVTVQKNGNVV